MEEGERGRTTRSLPPLATPLRVLKLEVSAGLDEEDDEGLSR